MASQFANIVAKSRISKKGGGLLLCSTEDVHLFDLTNEVLLKTESLWFTIKCGSDSVARAVVSVAYQPFSDCLGQEKLCC